MKNILILICLFWAYQLQAQNSIQYEYDEVQRLSKAIYSNGVVVQYTYDELGNRKTKVLSNANYAGLVGHYTFTGNANDLSPSGNHGTAMNGIALGTSVKGDANGSYCLDGTDDYINTPIQQNSITSYTISVWVKTTMVQTANGKPYAVVQTRGAINTGGRSLTLRYDKNEGKWFFGLDVDGVIVGQAFAMSNNNQWTHLAGTWTGTSGTLIAANQFKLYVNGALQSSTAYGSNSTIAAPISGMGTTKIGYHEAWNTYFQGCIDNVRIYRNQLLTDAEILAIYNQEKPCILPTAIISGNATVMQGQYADISIALAGTSPWNLTVNGNNYNTSANPLILNLNPATTTNYSVSAISNECGTGTASGNATINVIAPCTSTPIPVITSSPSVIMVGQSTILSVSNCSGTVTWDNNLGTGSTKTVSPQSNTNYTATCTIGSCISKSGSYLLTVNPNGCNFNIEAFSISSKCSPNTGQISLLPWGGTRPYTYAWTNGSTSSAISNIAPGNYGVRITTANKCVKDTTFTVNPDSFQKSDSIAISHPTYDQALVNGKLLTWKTNSSNGSYNLNTGSSIILREVNPSTNTSQNITLQGINNTNYPYYQIVDMAENTSNNSFSMIVNLTSSSAYTLLLLNVDYNYKVLNQFVLKTSTINNVTNFDCSNMVQKGDFLFLTNNNTSTIECYSRISGNKISSQAISYPSTLPFSLELGAGNVLYTYGTNVNSNKVFAIPFDNNGILQTPIAITTSLQNIATLLENQGKLYIFGTNIIENLSLGRVKVYNVSNYQEVATIAMGQNYAYNSKVWATDANTLVYWSNRGLSKIDIQGSVAKVSDSFASVQGSLYWANNTILMSNKTNNYVYKVGNSSLLTTNSQINHTSCGLNNGSITLTFSGAYRSIMWSNGGNTATISNLAAGNYTATVSPIGGGCNIVKTYSINSSSNIVAPTLTSSNITIGQTATLTATGCTGTINWYNVATAGTILATGTSYQTSILTVTTTYYASCVSNGCTSATRGSGTVTVSRPPALVSVAMYPFNGNANDESGNNHHLTNTNAILTTDRNGNANSAYYFNGSAKMVSDNVSYLYNTSFTISYWAKPDVYKGQVLIRSGEPANNAALHIALRNADIYTFAFYANDYDFINFKKDNKWHQYTMIYDKTVATRKIFEDGVLIGSQICNTPLYTQNSPLILGYSWAASYPDHFVGKLDDIFIFNRALTNSEASALYSPPNAKIPVSEEPSTTINIAPNPNDGKMTIIFDGFEPNETLTLSLYSTTGHKVQELDAFKVINKSFTMDFYANLPAGIYFLNVVRKDKEPIAQKISIIK